MLKNPLLFLLTFCSFALGIPLQGQVIYNEGFDTPGLGVAGACTTSDATSCAGLSFAGGWIPTGDFSGLSASSDFFVTSGGALVAQDTDTEVCFESIPIDISGFSSVIVSADISEIGDHESGDYVDFTLIVDGVPTTVTNFNGFGNTIHTLIGDIPDDGDWISQNVSETASGSSLVVQICVLNNAGTENIEIDNVVVEGFAAAGPPVVINEINYNPIESGTDLTEFIELFNSGSATIDLSGWDLTGVAFTFPSGASIGGGEYLVVAGNATEFQNKYGCAPDYAWGSGALSNGGETVALLDASDAEIDIVPYDDCCGWPTSPDGTGPSLELLDPSTDNALPSSWAASVIDGGTPGAVNQGTENGCPPPPSPIVINEINYNGIESGTDTTEFIELFNNSANAVDISGWSFSSGVVFTFPSGTSIDGGAYTVVAFDAVAFENKYGCAPDFEWASGGLSNSGETITLVDGSANFIDEVPYDDGAGWPTAADGTGPTLELTDANLDNTLPGSWAASVIDGGTPGAANQGTVTGCAVAGADIVINEINYNPIESGTDLTEFIELFNPESSPANLSGWSLGGVSFTFPSGATLDAGAYLVIAGNATEFEAKYGCAPDYEWSSGALSNGGETVSLFDASSNLVDEVPYDDCCGWPTAADGGGPTLELTDANLDNTLPGSWAASVIDGGTPGAANQGTATGCPVPPPLVVINEINYNGIESGTDVTEFIELFNAEASAVDISGWSFSSGVVYTFPSGTLIGAGEYLVVAFNAIEFEAKYGCAPDFMWTSGGLSNGGETITLVDAGSNVVDEVPYDDCCGWPTTADGGGPTLELLDPALDNSLAASWAASIIAGGTPGAANQGTATSCVPAAPSDLVVTYEVQLLPVLSWTDNSNNEDGFVLERSIGGGPFEQITTLTGIPIGIDADVESLMDTVVVFGIPVSYRIKAINAAGASDYSNTVTFAQPATILDLDLTLVCYDGAVGEFVWNVHNPNSITLPGIWAQWYSPQRDTLLFAPGNTQFRSIENPQNPSTFGDDNVTGVWWIDETLAPDIVKDIVFVITYNSCAGLRMAATPTATPTQNGLFAGGLKPFIEADPDGKLQGQILDAVQLYPNPCRGELTLTSDELVGAAKLMVFDVMGRVVMNQNLTLTGETPIDLSSLKTGVYMLQLQTEAGTVTRRLIRE